MTSGEAMLSIGTLGLSAPYGHAPGSKPGGVVEVATDEVAWNAYQWNPPQYLGYIEGDLEASPKPSWDDLGRGLRLALLSLALENMRGFVGKESNRPATYPVGEIEGHRVSRLGNIDLLIALHKADPTLVWEEVKMPKVGKDGEVASLSTLDEAIAYRLELARRHNRAHNIGNEAFASAKKLVADALADDATEEQIAAAEEAVSDDAISALRGRIRSA